MVERAAQADTELLVQHYLKLWDSYGVPRSQHRADAHALVCRFITEAGENAELGAFIARSAGEVAGSACCQVRNPPYPEVIQPRYRKIGYVWSVFVDENHRRQGVATLLMQACLKHLSDAGCNSVILHSSSQGLPLYQSLGFTPTHEMSINLSVSEP